MKSPWSYSLPLAILIAIALGAGQVQFTDTGSLSAPLPSKTPYLADALSANATDVDASDIECRRNRRPFSLRNLIRRQCDSAIEQLPQDPTQGTFHTGGNEDLFRLPVERQFENCQVLVGLNYGYDEETGSWAKLIPTALRLSRTCAKNIVMTNMLGGSRAGYVPAGDVGKIQITIQYIDPRSGANFTIADASVTGADTNTTAPDAVLAA